MLTKPNKMMVMGYGYTAKWLVPLLQVAYPQSQIVSTSRQGEPHLEFDLARPQTWDLLPQVDVTVWTFPPSPSAQVSEFIKKKYNSLGQVIALGSTSALLVSHEGQLVSETTPLDMSQDRVLGEQMLRQQGGINLLSAGIYGPGRDPRDWVRKGLVAKSPKLVNMVHVEDLCQYILACIQNGSPGSLYIAADNNPQVWSDVITFWESQGWLNGIGHKQSPRQSKRVDCSWSIKQLGVELKYPDFRHLDF
jgi:hypothetical protein